ncbi:MAG: hypothetical protein WBD01_03225 [Salaquimonas sp.]
MLSTMKLLSRVIAIVINVCFMAVHSFAQTAGPQALIDWQSANQVWIQANADFQNAGAAYNQAGAEYLQITTTASDQDAIANAQADWQNASQNWNQANIDFQNAGKAFLNAGAIFNAKSLPIHNAEGRYIIIQPSTIPVVVVNNGSVVHLKDLPEPFNKLVPSGQGPGKFAYNWSYADKIYGYAYLVVDENGSGKIVFEFTNGTGNTKPRYSSVAITPLDSQGNKMAIFGVNTYIHSEGGTSFSYKLSKDALLPIGGPPNHGHAHSIDITAPVEWWNTLRSLTIEWTEATESDARDWFARKSAGFPDDKVYLSN